MGNMWLVEKLEMAQVHFTLDREGSRDQKTWMDEESTWRPKWHQVENVSWSMDIALGPSKRSAKASANLGATASNWVLVG